MVDPWGREQARLGLGETGVLDAGLPLPLAATVFGQARYWPLILAVAACLLIMALVEGGARRSDTSV